MDGGTISLDPLIILSPPPFDQRPAHFLPRKSLPRRWKTPPTAY
jgi:hypothetical protein